MVELSLEEFTSQESVRLKEQKEKTTDFIINLTKRKSLAKGTEAERLQKLIDLHSNHLAELNNVDVSIIATEKFKDQQDRIEKIRPKPTIDHIIKTKFSLN